MNKYLIPICDIEAGSCWIHVIMAKSLNDCKEKCINYILDYYEFDDFDDSMDFASFHNKLNYDYNIIIGNITDIDEI